MPWWSWLLWCFAAVLALAGLLVIFRALFGDRARGRRRCPRCWYDMSGTDGLRCPECGRSAKSASRLLRTRRRPLRAAAGLLMLLAAYLVYLTPRAIAGGWWTAVPTPVLVLALQFYNDEAAERVFASVQARMLTPGANVSAWEKLLVARHCARMLRDTGPAAPILPAPAAAPIGLTPEEQAELNAIAAQPGTFGGGLSNASPRYQALAMLKELGPHIRPAVPALTALLDDTDSYSVLEATHLLGRASGSRASIAALTRQMASPLYHYRSAAARALGEHGPAAASAIPAIYEAVSRPKDSIGNVGVNALTKIGAASTRTLVGLLSDPRPSLRYSAADAMKKLGPRSATPEVLLALGRTRREDPIATVRLGAVIALGSLAEGDPKTAVPLLAEALGDQYAMVRYSAVKSLHALGPDAAAAADALRTATSSKEEYLSEAAAAALRAVQAAPKP